VQVELGKGGSVYGVWEMERREGEMTVWYRRRFVWRRMWSLNVLEGGIVGVFS
jgi:hypothetical protein